MTTIGADPSLIVNFIAKHDTLYADVRSLLKACEAALRQFVTEQPHISVGRFLVACWDEYMQHGRLYALASDGGSWGVKFSPVELDHYVSSANASAAYLLAAQAGMKPHHMLAIAEAQRAEPIKPDAASIAPYRGIGGNLSSTR
jgi:hypothetical protein